MSQVSISLRVLVLVSLLAVLAVTVPRVARGAPLFEDLSVNGNIAFTDNGQDLARDIHTGNNTGGLRFYSGTSLEIVPQGAAIQFFDNDRAFFNGQAYIDSGAHNNAAIILRTSQTGQPLGERLRIDAVGRVMAGSVGSAACGTVGDICAGDDIVGDFRVIAGSGAAALCSTVGDVCAGDDVVAGGDVVVGSGCVTDGVGNQIAGACPSDLRLKGNIAPLDSLLGKLTALQPVAFDWRRDEYVDLHLSSERSLGLIAQEVEEVLPELVAENGDGFKSVHYERLPLLMLQGMRELKAENDALREQNASLEARLAGIELLLSGGAGSMVASR
jgi:hypothetical protein